MRRGGVAVRYECRALLADPPAPRALERGHGCRTRVGPFRQRLSPPSEPPRVRLGDGAGCRRGVRLPAPRRLLCVRESRLFGGCAAGFLPRALLQPLGSRSRFVGVLTVAPLQRICPFGSASKSPLGPLGDFGRVAHESAGTCGCPATAPPSVGSTSSSATTGARGSGHHSRPRGPELGLITHSLTFRRLALVHEGRWRG